MNKPRILKFGVIIVMVLNVIVVFFHFNLWMKYTTTMTEILDLTKTPGMFFINFLLINVVGYVLIKDRIYSKHAKKIILLIIIMVSINLFLIKHTIYFCYILQWACYMVFAIKQSSLSAAGG